MNKKVQTIEIRTSPHIRPAPEVEVIMRNVVLAIVPTMLFAVYRFGISALLLTLVLLISCIWTERLFNALSRNWNNTTADYSAMITGMLLSLSLPPGFPLWMGAVAGFISIALGKVLFGGLGFNIFNPALVGRAFVQAAFPVAITTWTPGFLPGRFLEAVPSTLTMPFMLPNPVADWLANPSFDSFTGATPLALQKFEGITTDLMDLIFGNSAGSAGEASILFIIAGGLYLAARGFMEWRIPVAIIGSTFIFASALHLFGEGYPPPMFVIFSGGLMLGAVFMATDMVGSPVTPLGIWIYGAVIGIVTVVIRQWGGLTEGVMYAILLGNAMTPLIDAATRPRVFGTRNKGVSRG